MIADELLGGEAPWALWTARVVWAATFAWLAAAMLAVAMRTASAALRHRVWALSVVAALALPVLIVALPELRLGWLDLGAAGQVAAPAAAGGRPNAPDAATLPAQAQAPLRQQTQQSAVAPTLDDEPAAPAPPIAAAGAPRSWHVIFLLWYLPAAMLSLLSLHSAWSAGRLVRSAAPIDDPACRNALCRLRAAYRRPAAVELRESAAVQAPLCAGWLQCAIILPLDWRDWPRDVLTAVLTHEYAHVIRRDIAWQLLARVACAIYWFHPLAWLAAWRMRVEREAACDDWTLSAGQSPVGYARVLLSLAAKLNVERLAPPSASVAMFGGRGFECRIRAILSQRRRRGPVGRSTAWLLTAAACAAVLVGGAVNPLAPTRAAAQAKRSPAGEDRAKPKLPREPLHFVGRVVDGNGRGVAGAQVETFVYGSRSTASSATDGRFELSVPKPRGGALSFRAASEEKSRQAFLQLAGDALKKTDESLPELMLVLRPAREILITVVDAAQHPVAGAWAAATAYWYEPMDETTTNAAGKAVLRVPSDAEMQYVVAAKADAGLDYFVYRRKDESVSDPYKLPPDHHAEIALRLNGVRPAAVNVVDQLGRPMAEVNVSPWYFEKPNKGGDLNTSGMGWFGVTTGADGRAAFRAIPADLMNDLAFWPHREGYVHAERPVLRVKSEIENLTATMLPLTPVSGRVTFADGRPAAGAVVDLAGRGYQIDSFRESVRADENGRFEILVHPDQFYLFAASLDRWASALESRVVRLDKPLADLHLTLVKATRVYGRVTMAGDGRPMAGEYLTLYTHRDDQEYRQLPDAEKLPNPEKSALAMTPRITRSVLTDAEGKFEFFAGPGHCYLIGPRDVKPPAFEITDQPAVELILYPQRPDRVEFAGQVVLKSAPEQRLKGVNVLGSSPRGGFFSAASGADGTFRVERSPSRTVLQALSSDERLGAVEILEADVALRVIHVAPTAAATGRLIDAATGRPLAKRQIRVGLQFERFTTMFYRNAATDARGEFELHGFVPGEEYALEVAIGDEQKESPRMATVKQFKPESAETVELGDIEVEAKPQ